MLSARVPISTHCKSLAYYNGLTRVRRPHRFKEDPRPVFKLLLMRGRIDYLWVESVENWRQLVGPEVAAKVDAIDKIEWAVNNVPSTASRARWQTMSGPRSLTLPPRCARRYLSADSLCLDCAELW
jgi:hypothetical protein